MLIQVNLISTGQDVQDAEVALNPVFIETENVPRQDDIIDAGGIRGRVTEVEWVHTSSVREVLVLRPHLTVLVP
jgi:hypothetical protein